MSRCGADIDYLDALVASFERAGRDTRQAAQRLALRSRSTGVYECGRCAVVVDHIAGLLEDLTRQIRRQVEAFRVADAAARAGLIERKSSQARVALEAQAASPDGRLAHAVEALLEDGRQIIQFDPSGEGRVVEVFGDLATARNVAVVVGGMGSSVDNFDSKTGARASNLFRYVAGLGAEVAVVAWNGYDAPDELGAGPLAWTEVVATTAADRGIGELNLLLDELALPEAVHLTLLGHSYGSLVVAGVAASRADVDDIVVMGSPGVAGSDPRRLNGGVRMWTMAAPSDPIDDLGWFGGDPNDPGTGWTPVDVAGDSGHGSYLTDGSRSLDQAALVVMGRGDEVDVITHGLFDRLVDHFDDGDDLIDLWRLFMW